MSKNLYSFVFSQDKFLIHFLLSDFFNIQTFYSLAITVPVNFAIHNFSVNSKKNTAAMGP